MSTAPLSTSSRPVSTAPSRPRASWRNACWPRSRRGTGARLPSPQPRHSPMAYLVDGRHGLGAGPGRTGWATGARRRPRLAWHAWREGDCRGKCARRAVAPPWRARPRPDRDRRSAQRVSARAGGSDHSARGAARRPDRSRGKEVRALPPRLDAAASSRERARRLPVDNLVLMRMASAGISPTSRTCCRLHHGLSSNAPRRFAWASRWSPARSARIRPSSASGRCLGRRGADVPSTWAS